MAGLGHPQALLTACPLELGLLEQIPMPLPQLPSSSSGHPRGAATGSTGIGGALRLELTQLLLLRPIHEARTSNSVALSPLTGPGSDLLPPPFPYALSDPFEASDSSWHCSGR